MTIKPSKPVTPESAFKVLDVVKWPEVPDRLGTIVELFDDGEVALIEYADDHGVTQDMVTALTCELTSA